MAIHNAYKALATEISSISSWYATKCELDNTSADRFTQFSLLNLLAFVHDRFIEAREPIKKLYKKLLITSTRIWTSRFVQMNAESVCQSDQNLQRVIKERWLSAKANNTMVSVLEQTIENDET